MRHWCQLSDSSAGKSSCKPRSLFLPDASLIGGAPCSIDLDSRFLRPSPPELIVMRLPPPVRFRMSFVLAGAMVIAVPSLFYFGRPARSPFSAPQFFFWPAQSVDCLAAIFLLAGAILDCRAAIFL